MCVFNTHRSLHRLLFILTSSLMAPGYSRLTLRLWTALHSDPDPSMFSTAASERRGRQMIQTAANHLLTQSSTAEGHLLCTLGQLLHLKENWKADMINAHTCLRISPYALAPSSSVSLTAYTNSITSRFPQDNRLVGLPTRDPSETPVHQHPFISFRPRFIHI